MKPIRRLYQSFRDGANEVNQKIISVIYRWCKGSKTEDYISHSQMVQMMQIRRFYKSFGNGANEVNETILSVIYRWCKGDESEDYVNHLWMMQM